MKAKLKVEERENKRLRNRLLEMEDQLNNYYGEYPGPGSATTLSDEEDQLEDDDLELQLELEDAVNAESIPIQHCEPIFSFDETSITSLSKLDVHLHLTPLSPINSPKITEGLKLIKMEEGLVNDEHLMLGSTTPREEDMERTIKCEDESSGLEETAEESKRTTSLSTNDSRLIAREVGTLQRQSVPSVIKTFNSFPSSTNPLNFLQLLSIQSPLSSIRSSPSINPAYHQATLHLPLLCLMMTMVHLVHHSTLNSILTSTLRNQKLQLPGGTTGTNLVSLSRRRLKRAISTCSSTWRLEL